jgi:hypothetical protein
MHYFSTNEKSQTFGVCFVSRENVPQRGLCRAIINGKHRGSLMMYR